MAELNVLLNGENLKVEKTIQVKGYKKRIKDEHKKENMVTKIKKTK